MNPNSNLTLYRNKLKKHTNKRYPQKHKIP